MSAGAFLSYVRLIPVAVRVTLAGGATYGTVKMGTWSDSTKSKEKLQKLQQSIHEIEYTHTATTRKSLKGDSSSPDSVRSAMAVGWNGAVHSACKTVVSARPSDTVGQGLRNTVLRVRKWTENR